MNNEKLIFICTTEELINKHRYICEKLKLVELFINKNKANLV